MRSHAEDRLAGEADRAGARAHEAEDRIDRRRLAHAVAAHERDDLALPHIEIDAEERLRCAVEGFEAFQFEHHAASPK
ncbi:hypothetical protein D9M70_566950 [compost metagenome]